MEAECAPEPVWAFWERENCVTPSGTSNLDHPAHILVTIQKAPSQLLYYLEQSENVSITTYIFCKVTNLPVKLQWFLN
jgi:hypothetical protein